VPIVNIEVGQLNDLLGQSLPPEELSESLEQIGCDVEDVVEIGRHRCPQCRSVVEASLGANEVKVCPFCGFEGDEPFPELGRFTVIRLDLLAARPDLFDVGGLARALRGTLELELGLADYPVRPSGLTVKVDPSVADDTSYWPHIRAAALEIPPVDEASLVAIMKLQENLHWGIGRDRKLASIGIYDLDTLEGPITYRTLDPDGDPFEPLGAPGTRMTGRQILEEHPKGIAYAGLLSAFERYPVLMDANGQVLSMPPIINSEGTKLKEGTRRLFVEVTGPSQAAVERSLRTLVASLAELGGEILSVEVDGPDGGRGGVVTTPDLTPGAKQVDLDSARAWLGLDLDDARLERSFRRMRFDVTRVSDEDGGRFEVRYPAFRTDVKHMVDLFEDLAIGYGYQNIEPRLVPTMTVGGPRPEEVASAPARSVLLGLGFNEVMSLPMVTEEDHYLRFRLAVPEHHLRVANPKMRALTVVREHLLTGLLQALHENRRRPLPLRLFELDNVAILDASAPTGAREERRLAFAVMGPDAGYAAARAVTDALLREMGVEATYQALDSPLFMDGRGAEITSNGVVSGRLGELHPEVILGFGLGDPVVVGELTLARVV
jgi:phenylalanyl-tRNA synthetase beta chain